MTTYTTCATSGTARRLRSRIPAATTSRRAKSRYGAARACLRCARVAGLWPSSSWEQEGDAAEITQVFVHPNFRAAGRGTAMTAAAIEAAGDVRDLWIAADDEDRAKHLYERLGFRAAWTAM